MKHLAIVLLSGLLCLGCGPSEKVYTVAPGERQAYWLFTPGMVRVRVPVWLSSRPRLKNLAFAEIDAAGTPVYVEVHIYSPGSTPLPGNETVLVGGWADLVNNAVHVKWRFDDTGPYLPALQHELDHIFFQDVNYGH